MPQPLILVMPDSEKINILIVDDLPEKLLVYETILEELDENLVSVRSGAEALREVLRRDFAVILLDINMPGMDGLETAQLIRQRKSSAHTPIIFLTAFADEVRTAQGYASGAVDYLLTPVVPDILRAKVRVFTDLFRLRKQVARQAEEEARRAAAEESARRSAFLAEASRALTSSLDLGTTIRQLLRAVVPTLADLAAVTYAVTAGKPWRSELAWLPAPLAQLKYRSLTAAEAPQDALRACHDRVLASGAPEVLEGLDIAYPGKDASDAGQRVRSAMVLPLVARGRTLGALTLTHAEPRCLGLDDCALAEDLASRAAIALDNALLVRDIQENDQRKNEFLAMLAHELRNPLAPIRSALDVLQLMGPEHPDLKWAFDVMDRQVNHLVRMVDDLLDVSRITRGKIQLRTEIVDLASILASAIETSRPLIEVRGHQLTVSLPPGPLKLRGDPTRLAQVFANLLNNAAKYTPDSGHITLTAERDGATALVRVTDSGAGIPEEMLPTIFDLFIQINCSLDRSQGGLGIGLTLVRQLVEMHGGTVEAHSEGPGRGSEFIVRLPLVGAEESEPNDQADPPLNLERPRCRVLVVDDNVDAADTLAMLLRASEHQVKLAHSGADAIESARQYRPQVVLLDIGLPGMDGYEVARRLRAEIATRSALLVAVSGYAQDEDRIRSREAGFDHHLTKPVDFRALTRLLSQCDRLAQGEPQLSVIG